MADNTSPIRMLVVDDEPDLRELYVLTLQREGWQADEAGSVAQALQCLARHEYEVAIVDMRLPDGEGTDILAWAQTQRRAERIIMATAYGSAASAVQALKLGAYDYLTKPVELSQLRQVVRSALGHRDAPPPLPTTAALQAMVGESAPMLAVKQTLRRCARGMAPVLIQGESGTGKELAARALHELSNRAGGPFVAVNCSAIPEHLLEAEFFGYRKGAFTGATSAHEGFFAAAAGGTLFLDEIGELPLSMQAKLLRAVQERKVRAIGETAETPVDVRLVSATHRDLQRCVSEGSFRQDLYYRLNVIAVTMPALRERLDDLPLLVEALLARIRHEHERPGLRLDDAALHRLRGLGFAGNVRELENLLHRAATMAASDLIGAPDLEPDADRTGSPTFSATQAGTHAPAHTPWSIQAQAREPAEVQAHAPSRASGQEPGPGFEAQPQTLPTPGAAGEDEEIEGLAACLDDIEREALRQALLDSHGDLEAAAGLLGLLPLQLQWRLRRLHLDGR